MSEEEKSYIPSLTLEPNAQAAAAVAVEAKEALSRSYLRTTFFIFAGIFSPNR